MSNTELTNERLASRIERLERITVRMMLIVVAAFVTSVIIVSYFMFFMASQRGMSARTNVAAENFVLHNSNGDVIAQLGSDSNGMASLRLIDAQKKARLVIYLQRDGLPGLSLLDPQSQTRATLSLNDAQAPSLVLFDAQKNLRAFFGLDVNSAAVARLFSSAGGLGLNGADGTVKWNPAGGVAEDLPVQK